MVEALARRSRRFGIVGGIEDVRFASATPMARLEQLSATEKTLVARRQQQGDGTYLTDIDREARRDAAAADALALAHRIGDTAAGRHAKGLPADSRRRRAPLKPSLTKNLKPPLTCAARVSRQMTMAEFAAMPRTPLSDRGQTRSPSPRRRSRSCGFSNA